MSITARQKLDALKAGKVVITNDAEFDSMRALEDDAICKVRSVLNPHRLGLRDQYIAWIGPALPVPDHAD